MSAYYYYYLDCKADDGWHRLRNHNNEDSDDSSLIFWHTRSYGSHFADHYETGRLPFSEYCSELQDKYREAYEKVQAGASRFAAYYPEFYQLDLAAMLRDFEDNLHESDGIISKNALLKLQRDSEYEPETISAADFNKLPPRIQDNYIFHAWDSPWSEYGHIYDIIPTVKEIMNQHKLSVEDVRLTYYLT